QTWMISNNSSQNQGIIENGYSFVSNGYALRKYPDGKIWFHTNIFSVSSTTSVSDNQWYHIAVSRQGGTIKIFINGVEDGNVSNQTSAIGDQTYPLKFGIGNHSDGNGEYFNGNIDEVAIWNDALSAMEVATLYNSGNPLTASTNSGYYTSSSNLKGYWQLNEGSGTYTTDGSGNGNPGTISGATWSTDIPGSSTTSSSGGDDDGSIELLTGSSESGVSGNEQGYPLNSYYHDV
ncbi:uncharacterized protein METZ01_LOCUS502905, partial [marine metagenome]